MNFQDEVEEEIFKENAVCRNAANLLSQLDDLGEVNKPEFLILVNQAHDRLNKIVRYLQDSSRD